MKLFYPPSQEQNDEVPRYENVYIDLPGMSNNIDLPTGTRGTELPLPLFFIFYISLCRHISHLHRSSFFFLQHL
jgi:hypothetical protein